MELLEGDNLGELLRRSGRMPPAEAFAVLSQVGSALEATHAAGVVHRDLKPDNLFLTRRGGSPHVMLLDFGIAKRLAPDARATRCLGTPLYMAPEQLSLEELITPAVDVYALGQLAFTLLVGREYWHPSTCGVTEPFVLGLAIAKGVSARATERAARCGVDLPIAFDGWFARACARLPKDRFSSPSALVSALADVLETATGRFSLPLPASHVRIHASAPAPASSVRSIPVATLDSGAFPAGSRPASGLPPAATSSDEAAYERLIEVLAPFWDRRSAERDVRRAVEKICGARPDASLLEYVVEAVMATFPKTCVSTRASMCLALINFCEQERQLRVQRSGSRASRSTRATK
jgi:eukaryotic-like serine/threonine-protein kinase